MRRAIILSLLALALAVFAASCAPDPRREADAYATRQQADALAAQEAQALEQDADAHALWMARTNEVSQWISAMMMTSMIAGIFTLFVAIVSFGIGASIIFIGGGIATTKRIAMPNRIRLDPVTRQFPLLPVYIGNGRYSLTNPNDGSVLLLDTSKEADMLKVKAAFGIQYAGALAYQARLSHKPGEITKLETPQILLEAE